MATDSGYLWAPMRNGGEVTEVTDPLGRPRRVVTERNLIPVGEKVTKSKLGVSDEDWDALVETGVVRTYEYPDGAGPTESPVDYLRRTLREQTQSEEEKLVAAVQGATSTEEGLVEAAAKDEGKK